MTTSVAPDIPPRHEQTVREVHRRALPDDEPLLAVVDASVWGSAADHLAITARRVLWKAPLHDPHWLFLGSIGADDLHEVDGEARIGGTPTSFSGGEGRDVLERIRAAVSSAPVEPGALEDAQVAAIQRRLSAWEGLHYAPAIPEAKERAARTVHARGLPADEPILALHDDTVFGGGDDGFVLTGQRLCARTFQRDAWSLRFAELDPRLAHLDGGWLQLGAGRALHITDAPLLARLRSLLDDLAAREAGPYR